MFRLQPQGPPQAYKTYQIVSPISTHHRPATCAEVGCAAYEHGWQTRVEGLSPGLLHLARTSGRTYVELQVAAGETWLVFEAGQPCFRAKTHTVPLERPELYVVRGGDWRGNPRGDVRRHSGPDSWVNDFAEHQDRIARIVNG